MERRLTCHANWPQLAHSVNVETPLRSTWKLRVEHVDKESIQPNRIPRRRFQAQQKIAVTKPRHERLGHVAAKAYSSVTFGEPGATSSLRVWPTSRLIMEIQCCCGAHYPVDTPATSATRITTTTGCFCILTPYPCRSRQSPCMSTCPRSPA